MHKNQCPETPQENAKQVLFYDVSPDMGLKVVFGTRHDNAYCTQGKAQKGDAFPVPYRRPKSSCYDQNKKRDDKHKEKESGEGKVLKIFNKICGSKDIPDPFLLVYTGKTFLAIGLGARFTGNNS